jgi:hypothetical protein
MSHAVSALTPLASHRTQRAFAASASMRAVRRRIAASCAATGTPATNVFFSQ